MVKQEDKDRAKRDRTATPLPADFTAWPRGKDAIYALYGDPTAYSSPEAYWLIHGKFVHLPAHFFFTYNIGSRLGFWAHTRCALSLEAIFREIAYAGLSPAIESFDGCYNHRLVRGGSNLSLHAFGAAIDLNARTNGLGQEGDISPQVIDIFKSHGCTWGGDYTTRKDPMHFSFGEY